MKTATNHACPKCDGEGRILAFSHIGNGTCFMCCGTGTAKAGKATESRSTGEQKVLRNSRYPGWDIIQQSPSVFFMMKDGHEITVNLHGGQWCELAAWVDGIPIQFARVQDAIDACNAIDDNE